MSDETAVFVLNDRLVEALKKMVKVAPRVSTLPVLTHLKVWKEKNELFFAATDLESLLVTWIGCSGKGVLNVCVPAAGFLAAASSSLPELALEGALDKLVLKSALKKTKSQSTVKGIPAEEFPVLKQEVSDGLWVFEARVLKTALRQVVFSASKKEDNPILQSVCLSPGDKNVFLVAADGFRMAIVSIASRPASDKPVSEFVLPVQPMKILSEILPDDETEVRYSADANFGCFSWPGHKMFTTLREGRFPAWQQIVPQNPGHVVAIPKGFEGAVNRADLFAREAHHVIAISPNERDAQGGAQVWASVAEIGESFNQVPMEVPFTLKFNAIYLIKALQTFEPEDALQMKFSSLKSPMLLTNLSGSIRHVIMPVLDEMTARSQDAASQDEPG